jgi:hypothetical protein
MTEIHIEKKPKPLWPWIIGALFIVLAIILIFGDTWQKNIGDDLPAADITGNKAVPQEIENYIAFVKNTEPNEEMEKNHQYTSEGIQKLASALDALVDETAVDVIINEKKDRLRQTAAYFQQDPYSSSHADSIKMAFNLASEIIMSMQQQAFPELGSEAESVRSAAQNVDQETLTLDQKGQVKTFFEESASAIDAMARNINGNGKSSN